MFSLSGGGVEVITTLNTLDLGGSQVSESLGSTGFTISGLSSSFDAGVSFGRHLANLGDINGDGKSDILIGDGGSGVYVVFGTTGVADVALSSLQGSEDAGFIYWFGWFSS